MSETATVTAPTSWPPSTTEIIERRRQNREQQETDERDRRDQSEASRLSNRAAVRAKIRQAKLAEHRLAEVEGLISDAGLVKAVSVNELKTAKAAAKATLADIDKKQLARLERNQGVDSALESKRRELLDDLAAREMALKAVLERQDNRIAALNIERMPLATTCHTSDLEQELFQTGDPAKLATYHRMRLSNFTRPQELREFYEQIVSE